MLDMNAWIQSLPNDEQLMIEVFNYFGAGAIIEYESDRVLLCSQRVQLATGIRANDFVGKRLQINGTVKKNFNDLSVLYLMNKKLKTTYSQRECSTVIWQNMTLMLA